jgi:hypothetical protein
LKISFFAGIIRVNFCVEKEALREMRWFSRGTEEIWRETEGNLRESERSLRENLKLLSERVIIKRTRTVKSFCN